MNTHQFTQRLKPWMLPIAMVLGILFHNYMHLVEGVAPYLIFIMLFVAFTKVKPSEFRITRLSWSLLAVQLVGSIGLYALLRPFSETLAIGAFICVFCPTATAAPVITGMLGGSVSRLVTYSIVCNVTVALLAPVFFTIGGDTGDVDFMATMVKILSKVGPLIVLPLLLAFMTLKVSPKTHAYISRHQSLSFYIWAVSLLIVVGRAVSYVVIHHENIMLMVALALVSLVACCGQFYIGRRIGRRCGDPIAGAQGLGQKNTVLAIWMAFEFFSGHQVASIAPAAYIAWQNIINSAQLYYKAKKDKSGVGK